MSRALRFWRCATQVAFSEFNRVIKLQRPLNRKTNKRNKKSNRKQIMKLKTITSLFALAVLSAVNHQISVGHAQGSLTPPAGAPAPVMKSLDQVEARIPLVAGQPGVLASSVGTAGVYYTITNPGSYYLTTNVLATAGTAIRIGTNNVTLDLNGYAIIGNPSIGNAGISISVRTNIIIRNGSIQNCGYNGILDGSLGSQNILIENICVTGCGSQYLGTKAGILTYSTSSVVRNCLASDNKGSGFDCGGLIKDCMASQNTESGFYGGMRVENCTAVNNARNGIYVINDGAVVLNNTCSMNNTANSSSYAGINVAAGTAYAQVMDNTVTTFGVGALLATASLLMAAALLAKNWVSGFGANNYSIPGGNNNDTGPIGTVAAATSPFANISK
jgi:hypothetical protein